MQQIKVINAQNHLNFTLKIWKKIIKNEAFFKIKLVI